MDKKQPRYSALTNSLPASVPFVGAEVQERARGQVFAARLGANESGFGASPKALAAIQSADPEIWKYGDSDSYDLKAALSDHLKIPVQNIAVGEGIDGLLGYLVRLIVAQGDAVVTSLGGYPTFNYHVTGYGGVLHTVPYIDDHADPASLIAKAQAVDAKLIYIANPDNPMGTYHSAEVIQRMIDAVPAGCLLILDEAYSEFAPRGTLPAIDIENPQVIRMRTFSKAYGLAGARVGYAIGQADLIKNFDKVRNHFGMNRSAQIGALAALNDQDYLEHVISQVQSARERLYAIAHKHGLTAIPSATNFVAIDCGKDGDYAKAVLNQLLERGVFVRMPFVAPQDRCIRVSVGTPADLDLFDAALGHALKDAK
ncbi:MAG: histidinol-phosphate aminotransferase [Rhodobacteraceae bacterium]|nr:MAG: histidinol-phosphate aminotransferase [Paracoccaceae bacterium]